MNVLQDTGALYVHCASPTRETLQTFLKTHTVTAQGIYREIVYVSRSETSNSLQLMALLALPALAINFHEFLVFRRLTITSTLIHIAIKYFTQTFF